MSRLVLVPSPFVGAGSWRGVAAVLPDATAADYSPLAADRPYEAAAERIVGPVDAAPWVAVLHSGAGGLAPAIAAAAARLVGLIFIDAILPYPGRSYLETAPQRLAEKLRALTTDGRLPPWNEWFGADPTLRLIPDPEARTSFNRDLPRVPSSFLDALCPASGEWERLPCAYVQLSQAYAEMADEAEQRGWIVRRASSNHLAMVTDPASVADLLQGLP